MVRKSHFAMVSTLMAIISLVFLFYMGSSLIDFTKKYQNRTIEIATRYNIMAVTYVLHIYKTYVFSSKGFLGLPRFLGLIDKRRKHRMCFLCFPLCRLIYIEYVEL